jgi:hypothetical protein
MSISYLQNLSTQIGVDARTQYFYDLSGVKYKTKSDLLTLRRQWDTYERVENINFSIYKTILKGIYQPWYVFASNEEASDYRVGQLLHVNRYPNIPSALFQSISLAPTPIPKDSGGPPRFAQAPSQIVSANPISEGQKTENNADMSIYIHVSTYNVLHSTFTYQFQSNEEQLAYHRAEYRLYAARNNLINLSTIAGRSAL